MTTLPLYRPDPRDPCPSTWEAFTTRPDIWPPGSKVRWPSWTPGTPFRNNPPWAWWYIEGTLAGHRLAQAESAGYHLPGVAESAVLAGQADVYLDPVSWTGGPGGGPGDPQPIHWTEVTP